MSPKLSNLAQSVGGSAVVTMRRYADALEARGVAVVDFGAGEPDFDVPLPVQEAAIRAIREGHGHYVDPRGLRELREAISGFESIRHGVLIDPDNIVVTPGSFGGLSLISRAIIDPGDEVLILEPYWGPYRNIVKLVGGKPVPVAMSAVEGRFVIDAGRLRDAVTERTRAIIINNPWNPTGRVLSVEELRAIAEIAEINDLWIVSDEVYSELVFDGSIHVSVASLSPDIAARTVTVTSFSKAFAMTGLRLGYCLAPPELSALLARINHYTSRCATSIVQYSGIHALTDGLPFVEEMRREYQARRDVIVERLNDIDGIVCPVPEGTFYAFPQFPHDWGDSHNLANYLLENSGIVLSPGTAYGTCSRNHLRLSFATSMTTIKEGMVRLVPALTEFKKTQAVKAR